MNKPIRMRVLRECRVRGVPCAARSLIEVDAETAGDLLMSASAAIEGPLPAGARLVPATAWREPEIERAPSFRIVAGADTAVATNEDFS